MVYMTWDDHANGSVYPSPHFDLVFSVTSSSPLFWSVRLLCCLLNTLASLLFIKTFGNCCSCPALSSVVRAGFFLIMGLPPARSSCLPTLLCFPPLHTSPHIRLHIYLHLFVFYILSLESKYHETGNYYLLLFPQCLALWGAPKKYCGYK